MIKGSKMTLEQRKNISNALKGKHCSPKTEFKKGHKISLKTRKKMSLSSKKKIPKGTHISSKTEFKENEKNPNWKGDKVGKTALHDWIRKHKPEQEWCEECHRNKIKVELANLSGKYRRDIKDYKWLCRGCHQKLDYLNGTRKSRRRRWAFLNIKMN
jgi:hypothetical protein